MRERPLSPHLQVYRPMLSMMTSIFHRITGIGLALGLFALVWWIYAAATSDAYFGFVNGLFNTWLGRLVQVGFLWALVHHFLGGFRYFTWDRGRGFDLGTVETMVRANWIGSILITLALVAYVWSAHG